MDVEGRKEKREGKEKGGKGEWGFCDCGVYNDSVIRIIPSDPVQPSLLNNTPSPPHLTSHITHPPPLHPNKPPYLYPYITPKKTTETNPLYKHGILEDEEKDDDEG